MRSKANLTYTHIENRRRTHRKSPEAWAKLPALQLFCRSLSHKATCDRLLPGWCHMESKAKSTPNKQKQQRQNKQPGSINRAASMWADERGCLYKQHSVLNKVLNRSQHVCIVGHPLLLHNCKQTSTLQRWLFIYFNWSELTAGILDEIKTNATLAVL